MPLDSDNRIAHPKNVFLQLVLLTLCILGGLFVGQFFTFSFLLVAYNFELNKIQELLVIQSFSSDGHFALLSLQAISSFSMFILAPWFYLKVAEQKSLQTLNTRNDYSWILLLYAFLLPLMVMPLTKLLVEWNEAIKLPPFLADFEQWAYQKEQELRKLTTFLTNFQSFGAFLVGVLIIAIIPAIGEEMVFRGLLQRKLGNIFSQHVAIWVAAFIFSAIHIQFYGLLPRMFLGVLLGYLYAWSGNIAYPMIAHFANNFLTLLMIYLYKIQWINVDIQSEVSVAWYSVAISLVFSSIALRDFYTRATGRA